ncbi:L,D-transpeptidase family protein [Mangrovibacterium lignilyticum]|uniref:L,D-transpeptidase family protein n=1 Tax=Mangrovibacterium lignilyticum TaxID=2668052 RepID=UPI0013D3F3C3|nr:L,D-transpeptidase family protein [Mangrovibacterium lignilyticum]
MLYRYFLIIILSALASEFSMAQAEVDENRKAHKKIYSSQDKIAFHIQGAIKKMEDGQILEIEGEYIFSANVLPEFYKNRDYKPAWDNYTVLLDALNALHQSWQDGLIPNDYHADRLRNIIGLIGGKLSEGEIDYDWVGEFDILVTDVILLYAYHLLKGKVDPESLDPNWNYSFREIMEDAPYKLEQAIARGEISNALHELRPDMILYRDYMTLLVDYRQIADAGGWGVIPRGKVVSPGDKDDRVPMIRERLLKTGELRSDTNLLSPLYDEYLVSDVKQFQHKNALTPDGIIGKGTFEALNETVQERIAKLRVNMERLRWVVSDKSNRFILVNIPAFKAYYIEDNITRFVANVQVGRTYTKTPVFKSRLHYIEFNPTWTVPYSIVKNSIIPHIKSDSLYLDRNNFELIDRSGNIVANSSLNRAEISPSNFPFMVRQKPGAGNSLGVVKFIFPNKYSVFLHDTPSKSLFDRQERAFSHGCIRTQNPLDLAVVLLEGTEWTREKIDSTVKSHKTIRVFPEKDIDVLLLYLTAGYYEGNGIGFFRDIYSRDAKVLEELNTTEPTSLKAENTSTN